MKKKIEGLRQDIITRGSGEILSDVFEIRINGVPYDDKKGRAVQPYSSCQGVKDT